jgi:hypothetical protein
VEPEAVAEEVDAQNDLDALSPCRRGDQGRVERQAAGRVLGRREAIDHVVAESRNLRETGAGDGGRCPPTGLGGIQRLPVDDDLTDPDDRQRPRRAGSR